MTSESRFRLVAAAAVLLFAAVYANSLRNGFHFDDAHVVETNLFIRDLANAPRFFTDASTFTSLPQNAVYRPLVTLSLAIDYAVGRGLDPVAFHAQQLILFAALGVCLFFFYRAALDTTSDKTQRWAALFAATLFCVHTGNTQAGNYISARSELLSALGVVGSFLMYAYVPRTRRFHMYLVPVAIGLFAKNHAVVFAPLLLVYKILLEEQLAAGRLLEPVSRAAVKRVVLSSIPAFVVLGALVIFVESMGARGQHYGGGSRLPYLLTSAWVWVRYVGLYFVPAGLTADTDLRLFMGFDARTLAGVALLAGTLAAAWFASRSREWRPVAFGIIWFWLALAPTSSVVPLAEVTNDHRPFLAFIGLNLAVVATLAALVRRFAQRATNPGRVHTATTVAASLVLLAHAGGTIARNRVWRDDETLWRDVSVKSPKNGRGLMNYGLALMRRNRLAEARALFMRARELNPAYTFLEANLGIVNNALGDPKTAEEHFKRAVMLDPTQPVVHRHYAPWLLSQGRGAEALSHFQLLVAYASADIEGRRSLMRLYAAMGADSALQRLARETVAIAAWDTLAQSYAAGRVPLAPATRDAQGWYDLGWSLTQAGQHVDAAQAYRASVAADPKRWDSWNNLGWTLGKLGFYDLAMPPLEKAIALKPDYQLAKNNLAWARREAPAAPVRIAPIAPR